jgi:hypothetical protein
MPRLRVGLQCSHFSLPADRGAYGEGHGNVCLIPGETAMGRRAVSECSSDGGLPARPARTWLRRGAESCHRGKRRAALGSQPTQLYPLVDDLIRERVEVNLTAGTSPTWAAPDIAHRDGTGWLGMWDSNSETLPQIFSLKGRTDSGIQPEFWPQRLFAFELGRLAIRSSGPMPRISAVMLARMLVTKGIFGPIWR